MRAALERYTDARVVQPDVQIAIVCDSAFGFYYQDGLVIGGCFPETHSEDIIYAYRVVRGDGIDGCHDGIVSANLLAGFSHLRNTRANPWVKRFEKFVRGCMAMGAA